MHDATLHLISIILPTRGRPKLALSFMNSLVDMADHPDHIEIVAIVDEDDQTGDLIDFERCHFLKVTTSRQSMGTYNQLGVSHSKGSIISLGNDDVIVKTKGWDTTYRKIHDQYHDHIYLAYPNDKNKGSSLCTFPFFSRALIVNAPGVLNSSYKGAFIDYHLMDIFMRLRWYSIDRMIYLEDVVFEHNHFRAGKSEFDQTYADRERFVDDQIFLELSRERKKIVNSLLEHLKTKIWKKFNHNKTVHKKYNIRSMIVDQIPLYWKVRILYFLSARKFYISWIHARSATGLKDLVKTS
jgi:hypothetical protein